MRQKTTEEDLRDSLSMYEDLVSNIPVGVCRFRMKALGGWQFDFVNSRFCELTGLNREDVLNNYETVFRLIHPDDLPEFICLIESVEKAPVPVVWEGRAIVQEETRWIRLEFSPTRTDNGDLAWSGYVTDFTDRKAAEAALVESELRFRSMFENSMDGILFTEPDGRIFMANPAACAILGRTENEICEVGRDGVLDLTDPRLPLQLEVRRRDGKVSCELNFKHKTGRLIPLELTSAIFKLASDEERSVMAFRDITERIKREDALRESEQRYQRISSTTSDIAYSCRKADDTGYSIDWMAGATDRILGYSVDEIKALNCWRNLVVDEDLPVFDSHVTGLSPGMSASCELRLRHKGGNIVWLSSFTQCVLESGLSNSLLLYGGLVDITERKRAEAELRESEERFRLAIATSPNGVCITRARDGLFVEINDAFTRMSGYTKNDVANKTSNQINVWKNPEDREKIVGILKEKGFCANHEAVFQRKDGSLFSGSMSASVISHKGDSHIISMTRDITDRIQAEQEKLDLQTHLFQSQKIESLGTLVGGIAHDFNNMLQIILGYSDLLLSDKKTSEPGYDELRTIIETAKGGADLVTKLLAFGQQAPIFPVSLDLNHQINQLTPLISRTLPQVVQIDLDLFNGPTTIHADPSQIDQMLMDLAINAAEAMPDGGRLKISTRTVSFDGEYCRSCNGVKRGSYVMLSVTDTGRGMDKETLSRIFEPFFSTKQRGSTRGTGLGLSVVKGIGTTARWSHRL